MAEIHYPELRLTAEDKATLEQLSTHFPHGHSLGRARGGV